MNLIEGVTPRASVLCGPEVSLEPTTQTSMLNNILSQPGIRESIGDDSPGEIQLPLRQDFYYFLAKIDIGIDGMMEDRIIGCLAFMPVNFITWNPHLAILPKHRGRGTQVMELGCQWMFANTRCKKIVAFPPEYNKAMIRVFEKCGFLREGFSPDSIMKNSTLHGRLLMGMSCGPR